jgi:ABC-type antimicrobial peptide transport system permease subunit
MFRNYFITAVRNLWRSKGSTIINLSGLTLGIASSLVLFLMVRFQSSFDNFHSKKDRIYRVVTSSDGNQGRDYTPGVPPALPEAFRNDFPEAEEVLFTSYRDGGLVTIPQKDGEPKKYEEERGIVYTQPNYFNVFDRKVLSGDGAKALDDPNEAVISKKAALKYFGKEDVLGEVLNFEKRDFKVTAIVDDYPSNTDLPFDIILSFITIKKEKDEAGWNSIWSDEQCYFLLKKDASLEAMEKRMPSFIKKYHSQNSDNRNFTFQPLAEIHYDDRFSNYNYNTTSKQTLTALGLVGIFLIITACINFINLVTAEAIKRSKEVGIRKSLGSSRAQLIAQFLGESSLVTLISVVVAVSLTQLVLGVLNPFLNLKLSLDFLNDGGLWLFLSVVTISVALLSGLYPSLVVSGFKPVFAIKNNMNNRNSSGYALRRGLVVTQFFISQFFIMGTIVLISQMNYFHNKDLGFRKDAIVNIPIPERENPATGEGSSKMRTLRDETTRLAGVEMASLCNNPPSSGSVSGTDFQIEGKDDRFGTQVKLVDSHYLDLFGLTLVAGNNLADLDTAQGFIVNEKLSSMVGYTNPNDIIGKRIKMWGKNLPVVGVVKNFHTVSLEDPIEATIMLNRIRNYQTLSLKLNPATLQESIKQVQQKWEAAYPDFIFSYEFMDVQIKEFYEQEEKMSIMLTLFTCLAIFIGCLGLFGLATFMANQKTKEVGVRKVLGASVESIIVMFSKEYARLIVLGFLLAAPIAWFVMNKWLDKFAYKIEIGPSIFIAGLGITALIAVLTVGYKSFAAATANPVKSLRSE